VGGNILLDNGSAINNLTMDTHKLKIYGLDTCTKIDIKNSGTLYGAIYAPNADIHLYNSVEVYGSVVGKSFTQDVSANVHYDASLRKASINDVGVRFVVKNWHEE
jgi:choice-of-anchor A domain-containing protein